MGLDPPKSNWATPLVVPPFRCYPVTGGFTFTYGRLAVDASGRVLSRDGAIKGLYGTGDIVGLFTGAYPAMAGQTRNIVFARAIGEAVNQDHKR